MSEYWYCIKHGQVEGEDGCANKDRLGPYDSAEQAARALEIAQERTEAWDNDPDWNDDVERPDGSDPDGPDRSG